MRPSTWIVLPASKPRLIANLIINPPQDFGPLVLSNGFILTSVVPFLLPKKTVIFSTSLSLMIILGLSGFTPFEIKARRQLLEFSTSGLTLFTTMIMDGESSTFVLMMAKNILVNLHQFWRHTAL